MRNLRALMVVAALVFASACDLEVVNTNNPERGRVLKRPSDVEQLAASQYQQIVSATLGSIARAQTGMMTASFMNSSALANNGLGPRSGIPRQPIGNSVGNAYQSENFAEFRILSFVARTASDVIARASASDFALEGGQPQVDRLLAWSNFVYGVSLGYLSLLYDQAGVPRPEDAASYIPPLEPAADINELALLRLDSALAYASRPGVLALPGGWLTGPGGASVTIEQFTRVIRSYKAQIRAGVARNSTQRAAVNWNEVISDATNGITSDLMASFNQNQGWDYNWLNTTLHFRDANWHQMTYYIVGMADTSGGFDAWLATPRDQRVPFVIVTPDLRFPQGTTRAAQNRPSADDDSPLPAGQYFRNRNPGKDQAGTGWGNSFYDHYRWRAFATAGRIGNFPLLTRAEVDMLAAEGYIRTNKFNEAAALIDRTRTAAGLPALTGVVTTATAPVPGGASCVPRVPASNGPTACGTIMEAMKWEKRLETAYTTWGAWFFDSRGWGDLPIGTAVEWPVPVDELNARVIPTYNFGGEGRTGGATESTYGYGVGSK